MGVTKLLPNVGPLCKVFEAARNRVIGVDAHVWLHHFAYACAEDIVARSDFEPLAKMFIQRAVKITDECIKVVISKLRMAGMPYVVAPYEADAQLAWLSEKGHIWAALTVDSDFIVHGVTRTFFKHTLQMGICMPRF